jgi:K+-sensing histidine kinase KdpD
VRLVAQSAGNRKIFFSPNVRGRADNQATSMEKELSSVSPDIRRPGSPAFERGLWSRSWFMLLMCAVFVMVDWEMMPLGVFPVVFIFPLMLVAWNRSLWFALACALLLSLSRVTHQFVFSAKSQSTIEVADALISFFVLVLLAALTSQLSRQARQLRQRVQQLEGILPICAGCKAIRDEKGDWIQLEGYITAHSPAQFSHSFCPACYKAYYGDLPAGRSPEKN